MSPFSVRLALSLCRLLLLWSVLLSLSPPGLYAAPDNTLAWEKEGFARRARLAVPATGKTGFVRLPSSLTGIHFTNTISAERMMTNLNLLNGSGVALGDYDGDGLCDIYICNLNGTNALYKNLGQWHFQDVTGEAGVVCTNQTSTGAVFADVNGDGFLDLLVNSMGGPNALFINDGHGHFTNATVAAGLVSKLGSTSMALADVDGNGTLDLYVANYGVTSIIRTGGALGFSYDANGKPVVRGRYAQRIKIIDGVMYELGEPDVLYLNDGHGKFTPVPWTGGAFTDEHGAPLKETPWDQSLSVIMRDLNGDGFPDIYVCDDAFTPDRCWINDGHGHFHALEHSAWPQTSHFSMGVDVADIDRDGRDDFMVVDMLSRNHRLVMTQKSTMPLQPRIPGALDTQFQIRRNTMFLNRGDGTFAEVANFAGLSASEWSWCPIFLDVDLDGWEDVLVSNGFAYDVDDADTRERIKRMGKLPVEEVRKTTALFPRLNTPIMAFQNRHDTTFEEKGANWGFDSKQIANGMALADLDNDGDLDLIVNCLNGEVLVYRNETSAPRIAVRLHGNSPNTQGIGAKIKVLGGPVTQTQEIMSGGRFLSSDDAERVFAAGNAQTLTIEVTWRNGMRSVATNCLPNYVYELDEAGAQPVTPTATRPVPAWFEDVSVTLAHKHHQEAFDDFARQPLLPRSLGQLGPGVAWFDVDGDGREDLIIGGGKGGTLAVYHNDATKGFQLLEPGTWNQVAQRDQTSVLGWHVNPGKNGLLVSSSNYHDGAKTGDSVLQYESNGISLKAIPGLPPDSASAGALALTDLTGEGHLTLFVGGRAIPGRYPEAPRSRIFGFDGTQWQPDGPNTSAVAGAGMVSGAVWSDLDGDGFPELILTCEWGPVRVYKNQVGKLHEITQELGLDRFIGWWSGVTTVDLRGDGKLDIIAGNWGLNSSFEATPQHPVRLYYGDWSQGGGVDLLDAHDDAELGIVPRRDFKPVSAALPFLQARFTTYLGFGEANIAKILGDLMPRTQQLQVNTLATSRFVNRGTHFDAVPLPREAQFAPAWAACVADADGDGHEDIFLSQNFFETDLDTPRIDSGRGLWLRGDGQGGLVPVPGQESGIRIYGEQRGAAVCDYDGDGRTDLVVTQNGTDTKLYHNTQAKPGLRVRLKGKSGNPDGIGAQMRLIFTGGRQGPVREIHAGSGYWSQDAAVQVLSLPATAEQLWIRWPGGKTTTTPVPAAAVEIEVDETGAARLPR